MLECDDPVFANAEKKDQFYHELFNWISKKIKNLVASFTSFPLEGLPIGKILKKLSQSCHYNLNVFSLYSLSCIRESSLYSLSNKPFTIGPVSKTLLQKWNGQH